MFLYSHVLLLPLGVSPMLTPPYFIFSHSHGNEICRVLTTTDVGDVTQGQGFCITKHYHGTVVAERPDSVD